MYRSITGCIHPLIVHDENMIGWTIHSWYQYMYTFVQKVSAPERLLSRHDRYCTGLDTLDTSKGIRPEGPCVHPSCAPLFRTQLYPLKVCTRYGGMGQVCDPLIDV